MPLIKRLELLLLRTVQLLLYWDVTGREGLLLEMRDNGVGFDTNTSFPSHLGRQSMRERVLRLAGLLEIESVPGQGTCIRARLLRDSH